MSDNDYICGKGITRIYRAEKDHVKVMAVKLRCGRWDCPTCAENKTKLIRERLKKFIIAEKCWMYTFTFKQDMPPLEKWREMPKVWNLFRTRITQKYGRFKFIRVVESHKNTPYPHLHVIANINIPETVFGKIAVESGFGYQLHKRECNERAPYYATKYLTKTWENVDSIYLRQKLNLRVVSWSRDLSALWGKTPKKPTVSVYHTGILTTALKYQRLFIDEFPPGTFITHEKTYKRGHVWRMEHPCIPPICLLKNAAHNIVLVDNKHIIKRLDTYNILEDKYDNCYSDTMMACGTEINSWG